MKRWLDEADDEEGRLECSSNECAIGMAMATVGAYCMVLSAFNHEEKTKRKAKP